MLPCLDFLGVNVSFLLLYFWGSGTVLFLRFIWTCKVSPFLWAEYWWVCSLIMTSSKLRKIFLLTFFVSTIRSQFQPMDNAHPLEKKLIHPQSTYILFRNPRILETVDLISGLSCLVKLSITAIIVVYKLVKMVCRILLQSGKSPESPPLFRLFFRKHRLSSQLLIIWMKQFWIRESLRLGSPDLGSKQYLPRRRLHDHLGRGLLLHFRIAILAEVALLFTFIITNGVGILRHASCISMIDGREATGGLTHFVLDLTVLPRQTFTLCASAPTFWLRIWDLLWLLR